MSLYRAGILRSSTAALWRGAACLSLAGLASAAGLAPAGQASAPVLVQVTALPATAAPARVFCTSSAGLWSTVTVVCSTGAVVGAAGSQSLLWAQAGERRSMPFRGPGTAQPLAWLDAQAAPGTVAGWQVLQQAGGDYVELTWRW